MSAELRIMAVTGIGEIVAGDDIGAIICDAAALEAGDVVVIAQKIVSISKELFGYGGRVVTKASSDADYLVDNPYRRQPDITKARTELDYRPEVDLDDGLRRSMIWYGDHRVASDA